MRRLPFLAGLLAAIAASACSSTNAPVSGGRRLRATCSARTSLFSSDDGHIGTLAPAGAAEPCASGPRVRQAPAAPILAKH